MSVCIQNMQRQRGVVVSKTHPTEHHLHLRALPFTLGHKHTPISAPPTACNGNSHPRSKSRTPRLHPSTHCAWTQRGWYPTATQIVPTPLQVLLEERKIYIYAIGYYGPARTRFTSREAIIQAELRALHLLAVPLFLEHTDAHFTARTVAPFSAPPACTLPTQLGLAPSRPPPTC
ncbi:hypothetical protein B0H13DRAFT_2309410 [Mycena leptocephala]|nr:hypothetical protein B0H13DRAFT_2309410 [Mycena leptocephala]